MRNHSNENVAQQYIVNDPALWGMEKPGREESCQLQSIVILIVSRQGRSR
jgi:hypothetical protein